METHVRAAGQSWKITRRADGRLSVTKRMPDGTRFQTTASSTEQLIANIERRFGAPSVKAGSVEEFVALYVAPEIERSASGTAKKYKGLWRNYVRPALGGHELRSVSRAQILDLLSEVEGASIHNGLVTVLRRIFEMALDRGEIAVNPADRLRMRPKPTPRERDGFLDLVPKIVAATRGTRLAAPVTLALNFGLRRGEICALKWADYSADRRVLTIRRSRQQWGEEGQTKGRTSRKLPVPEFHAELLESLRIDGQIYVATWRGAPLWPNRITDDWTELRADLGLPEDFRFHDLRSCAAMILAYAGAPPVVVQRFLGHSSISTQEYYQIDDPVAMAGWLERIQAAR